MDVSILREMRKVKGITQGDMARRLGIDQSWLSQIERGKKSTTIDMIERMAAEVDCELRIIIKP